MVLRINLMNFQMFLNLVGAGTVLGYGSRKESARARALVAQFALSLSREFFDYFLFQFFFSLNTIFLLRSTSLINWSDEKVFF
jgi:hypothetical protein